MTVRLSDEEEELRAALEAHFGTDGSGVMRMGMLKLARDEGFAVTESKPETKPQQPKHKPKRR